MPATRTPELLEAVEPGLELDGFVRAAGCRGLGIEEQDQRAGLEDVGQLNRSSRRWRVERRCFDPSAIIDRGAINAGLLERVAAGAAATARWGSR